MSHSIRNHTNTQGGAASRTGTSSKNTTTSRQQNSSLEIRDGHHQQQLPKNNNNQRQQDGAPSTATLTRPGSAGAGAVAASATAGSITQQQESWIKSRQVYQQQLLTEHFGFSPLSFVDDVINSVNNMIYQASMALQEFVENEMEAWVIQNQSQLPKNYDAKVESAKGMHKFETLLEAAVDKNFDRFELYALKNLFGVPEDVDIVLPHYEALDFGIGADKEEALDRELELLRQQVIMTKAMNYKLRKELALEEGRRRELERCREQIGFLKDALKEYRDVAPIPQTLIFIRDNIETLHRRFGALHEKLQRNAQADHFASSAAASTGERAVSSVTALHEALLSQEQDQRVMYIRSVVRRQIDEHLGSETVVMHRSHNFTAPPTPSPPS
ncbi:MAG: Mis12 protein-domain-containing protein [Linnemannia elongata]|nr:MAG: Mis12 protein-domain-containing protein [Linnemannia elongata]